jgi:hypothetical protein
MVDTRQSLTTTSRTTLLHYVNHPDSFEVPDCRRHDATVHETFERNLLLWHLPHQPSLTPVGVTVQARPHELEWHRDFEVPVEKVIGDFPESRLLLGSGRETRLAETMPLAGLDLRAKLVIDVRGLLLGDEGFQPPLWPWPYSLSIPRLKNAEDFL